MTASASMLLQVLDVTAQAGDTSKTGWFLTGAGFVVVGLIAVVVIGVVAIRRLRR